MLQRGSVVGLLVAGAQKVTAGASLALRKEEAAFL